MYKQDEKIILVCYSNENFWIRLKLYSEFYVIHFKIWKDMSRQLVPLWSVCYFNSIYSKGFIKERKKQKSLSLINR